MRGGARGRGRGAARVLEVGCSSKGSPNNESGGALEGRTKLPPGRGSSGEIKQKRDTPPSPAPRIDGFHSSVSSIHLEAGGVGGGGIHDGRSYYQESGKRAVREDVVDWLSNGRSYYQVSGKDKATCVKFCSNRPEDAAPLVFHEFSSGGTADAEVGVECTAPGRIGQTSSPRRLPYKEALLRTGAPQLHHHPIPQRNRARVPFASRLSLPKRAVRCYKCLGLGHLAFACRDPVRCRVCGKCGHKAFQCKEVTARRAVGANMNQIRARHQRERAHRLKAFVPLTEEYLRRVELRRNAVLADIIEPADLGNAPQQTIANALASRFGGYPQDFFVMRHWERAFAIILPRWVSAATLIGRQVITLDAFWLRCFAWGADRHARPHRMGFTAWIQLRGLPFECWTAARVASLVCGFGRFLRADEATKSLADLRVYRCRIVVDNVGEIPRRLSIVVGDEKVDISVFLESSERIRDGDVDPPPPPQPPAPQPRRGLRRDDGGEAGSVVGGAGAEPSAEVLEPAADGLSTGSVNRRAAAGGPEPLRLGGGPPFRSPGTRANVNVLSPCLRTWEPCDDRRCPPIGGGGRMPPDGSGSGAGPRRPPERIFPAKDGPTVRNVAARTTSEPLAASVSSGVPEGPLSLFGVEQTRGILGAGRCWGFSMLSDGSRFFSNVGGTLDRGDVAGGTVGPVSVLGLCCTDWGGAASRYGPDGRVSLTLFSLSDKGLLYGALGVWFRVCWSIGPSVFISGPTRVCGSVGLSSFGKRRAPPLAGTLGTLSSARAPFPPCCDDEGADAIGSDDDFGVGVDSGQILPGPAVAHSDSTAPSEAGPTSPGRCSLRLASKDAAPILRKAMDRKARLLGCAEGDTRDRVKARTARIQSKSKRCGVALDCTEANSFLEFADSNYV